MYLIIINILIIDYKTDINLLFIINMLIFRTVWYELLCGEWPFKSASPEVIIWNIGRGMKQRLANLEASGDVKVKEIV